MSISLRDKRTRRICIDALLIALAMMLSYLEFLLPLTLWIPLPGFRLGLANLVVVAAFCLLTPTDAALVSAIRIFLMGILFGSATSLYFSALGGLLSFLTLAICMKFVKRCSLIGISVLSAAAHNCGQILAATTLFGGYLIVSYLPWLLLAAVICGAIVGTVLNLLLPRLQTILERRRIL